ncbi:MAG: Ger(x)C family spore germination protein, partial [Oscillospiraceae bacterium]
IGIDEDGENVKLTLQLFSPSAKGNETIDTSADNAKIISATGKTVSEAFENATLKQGKKIFIGHNRIIIFGNEIAKSGLADVLSYFSSNPFSRQDTHLLVAEKTANEILTTKIKQAIIPAEAIEDMILNFNENGFTADVMFFNFMSAFSNNNQSAFLPIIKLKKESGEKNEDKIETISNIYLDGTAIFKDKKMSASINKTDTRGLLFMRDEIKKTTYLAKTEKFDFASVEIYKSSVKIIPDVNGEKIAFKIEITCDANLEDFSVKNGATYSDIPSLEKAVEEEIASECMSAFNETVIKEKADIIFLGDEIWQQKVNFWKKLENNWQDNCDKIKITVVP